MFQHIADKISVIPIREERQCLEIHFHQSLCIHAYPQHFGAVDKEIRYMEGTVDRILPELVQAAILVDAEDASFVFKIQSSCRICFEEGIAALNNRVRGEGALQWSWLIFAGS